MRRTLLAAVAALTAGASVALPALAATKSITVGDNYFIRKGGGTVTVAKGTTVKWVFKGHSKHTVVGMGSGSFINSGPPQHGGSYKVKAKRTGAFKIVCTIHVGQTMKLKVK